MSLFEDASLVVTPNGRKAGKIFSLKPFNGSGDLTVVRATTKTEVNASGVIVDVPINVPSFDYTNGSCPSILVEPQRTNLALRSEEFDNAYWTKTRSTITANATTSPKADVTADKLVETAVAGSHFVDKTFTTVASTIYSYSVFVKKAEREWFVIECLTTGKAIFVNLNDGSLGTIIGYLVSDIDVKSFDDGWFRISVKDTSPSTVLRYLNTIAISSSSVSYTGDGTSGIYIWGAQHEAGSNATSYIPTLASAVTRNADVISKTGISDLINSEEGCFYVEANSFVNGGSFRHFSLSNGTDNSRLTMAWSSIANTLLIRMDVAGVNILNNTITSFNQTSNNKVLIKWGGGNLKTFVNGVERLSFTSLTMPTANLFTKLGFDRGSSSSFFEGNVKSVLVFPTQLLDTECIKLTTL